MLMGLRQLSRVSLWPIINSEVWRTVRDGWKVFKPIPLRDAYQAERQGQGLLLVDYWHEASAMDVLPWWSEQLKKRLQTSEKFS